jgi:hypothetical protein
MPTTPGEPGAAGRAGAMCTTVRKEVRITDPAPLDADTARRIVRGVLDSGRVPRPSPRPTPRKVRILSRLWVGSHLDEGRPYVLVFIGDQCVIHAPTLDARDVGEVSSA